MGLQPTASNTALLLQCGRPFSDGIELDRDEPGIPARYGSALHAILAKEDPLKAATRFDVVLYRAELEEHAARVRVAEADWASRNGLKLCSREYSRAFNGVYSHLVPFDDESHTYTLYPQDIVAGTWDVLYAVDTESAHANDWHRVVVDYKTGDFGDYSTPASNAQMRTLAVLADASHVAIIHAPRGAPVVIYVEQFTKEMREEHIAELRLAASRIGDGSLRPGPACKYCPAKRSCPAFMSDVVKETNLLLRVAAGAAPLADPTDKGALHLFLSRFATLEKRARELLRADVEAGEVIQRPDGKVLQLSTKTRTNLSLASIRRALPAEEAEKRIEELRAAGCIDETTYVELSAK